MDVQYGTWTDGPNKDILWTSFGRAMPIKIVTPIFFIFLKNLKAEEVKLGKCFDLHRRLKNAIFFPDYRDTFTSALFITPFSLSLFVVTYVKAVENFISVITVANFEKFKQGL